MTIYEYPIYEYSGVVVVVVIVIVVVVVVVVGGGGEDGEMTIARSEDQIEISNYQGFWGFLSKNSIVTDTVDSRYKNTVQLGNDYQNIQTI